MLDVKVVKKWKERFRDERKSEGDGYRCRYIHVDVTESAKTDHFAQTQLLQ